MAREPGISGWHGALLTGCNKTPRCSSALMLAGSPVWQPSQAGECRVGSFK